jgi:hypothetical protein
MSRRTAGTLLLAVALPVLPLTAATAAAAPGSALGSVSLTATAHGQEFLFNPQVPAQMSVPYAQSKLQLGEGIGLATVAWPGDTGAALGTTLIVGFGAPDQARVLNDPALASARSGTGDADVKSTVIPGATVHATATKTKATSQAALDGTSAAATTAGSSSATSSVELTGPSSAVGQAASTVRDVTLGVVHVGAVTSAASGATDGAHADAKGSTSVTGVTVAGVAVTVDDKGVSVAGTGVLPAGAADAVTAALEQAQITLRLTKPVKTVTGGKVEYSTGALVATTPLGTLTLGGAELVLGATPAYSSGLPSAPPVPTPSVGLGSVGGGGQPAAEAPGPVRLPSVVPPPSTAPDVAGPVALVPLSVRTGYGWAWLVSGVLLSFLAGSGLLGLSRRWLAPDLSGCPLERSPS